MAIAGLAFSPRFGNAVAKDIPGGVVLRGEVEWIVEGGVAEVAAFRQAVGNLAGKVGASAIVRFGNVVGTFDLGPYGAVRVECGKWSEDVFDALLEDLTKHVLALPFSATQGAGLPHDRSIADRDEVLLHTFIYARHILLASNRPLARALELVVRDPHRRLNTERSSVDLAGAHRVDARTIARITAGADGLVRAAGAATGSGLAHALRGHLPANVDVPRVQNTFDTAENRFVLEFLRQVRGIIARIERFAREKGKPGAFWMRALADCEAMRRVLEPFERHDMWIEVGRMGHIPIGSSVLQRRRGYKDVLHHHLALRAAARIPFDGTTVEKLLGLKDVATLYELWCYFAVVDVVREVLGRAPDTADTEEASVEEVGIRRGFRVAWRGGPAVHYNLSFSKGMDPPRHSASLLLRPDIVIEIEREGRHELHVFDAKLRVDGVATVEEESEDDEVDPLKFKRDDVAKMHAYRDALPHVRSARVLYPGNVVREFVSLESGATDIDVVGAIPLVPGKSPTDLRIVLARILGAHNVVGVTNQEPTLSDLAAVAGMLGDMERIEAMPLERIIDSAEGDRLIRAFYDHGLIMLEFDASSWQAEAQRFVDPEVVSVASLDEIRRLLTLHVRKGKFVEGHFAAMISNRHISALLRRLGVLVSAMRTTA